MRLCMNLPSHWAFSQAIHTCSRIVKSHRSWENRYPYQDINQPGTVWTISWASLALLSNPILWGERIHIRTIFGADRRMNLLPPTPWRTAVTTHRKGGFFFCSNLVELSCCISPAGSRTSDGTADVGRDDTSSCILAGLRPFLYVHMGDSVTSTSSRVLHRVTEPYRKRPAKKVGVGRSLQDRDTLKTRFGSCLALLGSAECNSVSWGVNTEYTVPRIWNG